MNLFDSHITLDGVRRTKDGYLAAYANVARTGVQKYKGHELGRPDLDNVMVYRSPEEVFHTDALKSMAHRPVTLTHPKEVVDAKNWKKYAKGHTGDEVVRDGDHVRVPMVLMDAEAIDAVEKNGTRELSMGYSTDLKWTPGVTDAGEKYDAVQTEIRANHLALVPVARGGDKLRFGDETTKSTMDAIGSKLKGRKKMPTIITIDGAPVEVADELSAAVINNKMKALKDASVKANDDKEKTEAELAKEKAAAAEAKKALDSATGEIAVLKKAVADAAITPEKLDVLVVERSAVVDAATTILDKSFVYAGKKLEDIRRAVVATKLGDAATKDLNDDSIEGAFKLMTLDSATKGTRALAGDLSRPGSFSARGIDTRDAAYADYTKTIGEAWRNQKVS